MWPKHHLISFKTLCKVQESKSDACPSPSHISHFWKLHISSLLALHFVFWCNKKTHNRSSKRLLEKDCRQSHPSKLRWKLFLDLPQAFKLATGRCGCSGEAKLCHVIILITRHQRCRIPWSFKSKWAIPLASLMNWMYSKWQQCLWGMLLLTLTRLSWRSPQISVPHRNTRTLRRIEARKLYQSWPVTDLLCRS